MKADSKEQLYQKYMSVYYSSFYNKKFLWKLQSLIFFK